MNRGSYINCNLILGVSLYVSQTSFCYSTETKVLTEKGSKTIVFYTYKEQIVDEADANGLMSSYLERDVRSIINLCPRTGERSLVTTEYMIKRSKDLLGTTDESGTTLNSIRQYNPYGKKVNYSSSSTLEIGTHSLPSLLDNPYGYSGYYTDVESGLCYLNARYYSPELMRFISQDSYDLPNRYAYADGRPITSTDPNGHSPLSFMNDKWWGQWLISMIPIVGPILMATDGLLSKSCSEMVLGLVCGIIDAGTTLAGGIKYVSIKISKAWQKDNYSFLNTTLLKESEIEPFITDQSCILQQENIGKISSESIHDNDFKQLFIEGDSKLNEAMKKIKWYEMEDKIISKLSNQEKDVLSNILEEFKEPFLNRGHNIHVYYKFLDKTNNMKISDLISKFNDELLKPNKKIKRRLTI